MTVRQQMIATYSARTEVAARRHAELNGQEPYELCRERVSALLLDEMSGAEAPYAEEVDRLDFDGRLPRFVRAVLREVEQGIGVRRGVWS